MRKTFMKKISYAENFTPQKKSRFFVMNRKFNLSRQLSDFNICYLIVILKYSTCYSGLFGLLFRIIRLFVPNYSACYSERFDGKPATCFSIYFGIYPLIVMPKYSTKRNIRTLTVH